MSYKLKQEEEKAPPNYSLEMFNGSWCCLPHENELYEFLMGRYSLYLGT